MTGYYAYYTIALIAFLAAVSPGPDFVVVAKNALAHNRLIAIMTSLGIGAGIIIHSTYCILGLAVIISQSLLLFSIIKYLGVSYLIYLGIKNLIAKQNHLSIVATKKNQFSLKAAFLNGLFTNVLNPKCTLFMLSVFTLVVKPNTPSTIQVIYGLEIAIITALWFVFLSYGLSSKIIKSKIERVQHIVTKLIGVVLISLGITILLESR